MVTQNTELVEVKEERIVSRSFTCDVCDKEIGVQLSGNAVTRDKMFYEVETADYISNPPFIDATHACSEECLRAIINNFIERAASHSEADLTLSIGWTHKQ